MLPGCKNFIEGADVKKQLEDRIAYENAPSYRILVEAQKGTGAVKKPAGGEAQKKTTDVFDISFDPDADFAFISWEIYDKTTGKLIPNGEYLKIARTGDDETTCQVVKLPDDPNVKLILKPVVVERPQIISATPTYDGNGAFRDSRIQVLFDRDMEIDSIYYTDAEIPEIKKTAGFNGFLPAYTFTTANGTQTRYYGYYKKTGENTEIIYKNISIIHNKNYGNLLEYFDAPRFEDPRRLIIPPKKSNLPPSGTGFQVSLNRDFFYTYEQKAKNYKKDIGMRSVHKWIFWVNEKTDTVNPSFAQINILNNEGDIIPTSFSAQNQVYLNKNKAILLRVSTVDEGSGPSDELDLKLYEKDAADDANPLKTFPLKYENNEGSYATFGNAIEGNIADDKKKYYKCVLNSLPDESKKYKFKLTAYDKTGNHIDSDPYYVSMDVTPPEIKRSDINEKYFLESSGSTSDAAKISCNFQVYGEEEDTTTIYYRKAVPTDNPDWDDWTEAAAITDVSKTYVSDSDPYWRINQVISNLENNSSYELKVELKDKAKNLNTYYFLKNTKPDVNVNNLSVSCDEFSRVFKITSSDDVSFCDTFSISSTFSGSSYTVHEFSNIGNNTFIYNPSNTDGNVKLFAVMGINYPISLKYIVNKEVINNTKYTNNSLTYNNKSTFSNTSLTVWGKPQGIKGFASYPVVTANSVQFDCTVKNHDAYWSIDIWYAMYDDDGNLGDWEGPVNYNNGHDEGKPTITGLTENKRYRFKFVTNKYGYACDNSQIVETEVVIKKPGAGVDRPEPVSELQLIGTPTMATATFGWYPPSSDDFDYYIVKWIKDNASSDVQPVTARVQKNESSSISFTANGLLTNTTYIIKVYTSKDGVLSNESSISATTTVDPSIRVSDFNIQYKDSTNSTLSYYVPEELKDWDLSLYRGSRVRTQTIENQVIPCSLDYATEQSSINLTKGVGNKSIEVKTINLSSGYYQIRAKQSSTDIRYSDIIYFDPQKSSRLKGLWATSTIDTVNSKGIVTFSWSGSYTDTLYYRYKEVSADDWTSDSVVNPYTSLTITGLKKDKGYDFEFATNENFSSSYIIAKGFATTKNLVPPTINTVQIKNTDIGFDNVKITWNPPANPTGKIDYYRVSYNYGFAADRIPIKTSSGDNTNSVIITGLTPNRNYTFYFKTVNKYGEETNCGEGITVKTAAAPVELYPVSDLVCRGNIITWSGTAAKYKVSYKKSSEAQWTVPQRPNNSENPTTDSSYYISDYLALGTQYDVKVVAMDEADKEAAPVIVSFYTAPGGPGFNPFEVTDNSIKVNWKYPGGNYFVTKVVCWPKGILAFDPPSPTPESQEAVLATIYYDDEDKPTSFLLNDLCKGSEFVFQIRTYSDPTLQVCSSYTSDAIAAITKN
ncbi:MAG: fibronectin type III domain-containing protein [Treponema sp.]|nr:fibronectin type III domain-containing protein [Treponema sp.]